MPVGNFRPLLLDPRHASLVSLFALDRSGRVTLRHRGRLHHIGIGNAYAGWRVAMLIEGLKIEIVGLDGSPLRRLVLDQTKDYQRIP